MASASELLDEAHALASKLALTAVERDRLGGTPLAEREALRRSRLLTASIPAALGGGGADWSTVAATVRAIARVDGSLAHVYGYQHLLLASVQLFGTPAQYERFACETIERRLFWGNALNPNDTRSRGAREAAGHYVVDGAKSYASGARDADRIVLSFLDAESGRLVVGVVPGDREGLTLADDWDSFGQRQTDSATLLLHQVRVERDELLLDPGPLTTIRGSLRPLLAQLLLTSVYVGVAEGALEAAAEAARERRTIDDLTFACAGELLADREAAAALVERAAQAFDRVWSLEDAVTAPDRGELAVLLAATKSVVTRTSLRIATHAVELGGARATDRARGLDRYWRDLRVHTLHDPVTRKHRDLGRWLVYGAAPEPSFYS
jgi:alkylation response protein AidB-like acyl-CoA dehydrogenase